MVVSPWEHNPHEHYDVKLYNHTYHYLCLLQQIFLCHQLLHVEDSVHYKILL